MVKHVVSQEGNWQVKISNQCHYSHSLHCSCIIPMICWLSAHDEDLAKWQTITALNIKLACTVYPCYFYLFLKVDYPTFVLGTPNFGCLVFYSAPAPVSCCEENDKRHIACGENHRGDHWGPLGAVGDHSR